MGLVALDKTIVQQLALNAGNRAGDARILGRQKTDQRNHQQAGIWLRRAVILHEGILVAVEALFAYLVVDGIAERTPAINGAFDVEFFDGLDGAVEGYPGHDLGMCEMAARSTHLPYT